MSTSESKGIIKGLPTDYIDFYHKALRTSTHRTLANNINHLADERSRVLVNYVNSSTTGGLSPTVPGSSTVWKLVYTFGPFYQLVGDDGLPYPIRVRIGGRVANGTGTLKIKLEQDMETSIPSIRQFMTTTFTDTTNQWRADGGGAEGGLLYWDRPAHESTISIYDGDSGTSPGSCQVVKSYLKVYALNSGGYATYCTQVYAAEYCGL